MIKTKSLHSFSIENFQFLTQLIYNFSTNHITINTSFSYRKKYYRNCKIYQKNLIIKIIKIKVNNIMKIIKIPTPQFLDLMNIE